jgi:hypothetical protein
VLSPPLFANVADRRDPQKVRYPLASLALAGVLMFLCRLSARRQIGLLLRTSSGAEIFHALFGVASVPHGDTLADAFAKADPDDFQEVVSSLVGTLIRKKVLYPFRLFDKYYVVAVDGTGTLTFAARHCPHCLTRTHDGHTQYYHNVLEAKLVTTNGFAFSLMTEFIENPGENPTKQDCELKAFYRLAERLKRRFPRLPLLLTLDGLFAGGPTFALCRRHGWSFMIVLKDKDLPSVNEEFAALQNLQPENHLLVHFGKKAEIQQEFRWVDDLSYLDSEKKEHTLAVLECLETKPAANDQEKTTKFKWVTNLRLVPQQVSLLANQGGRIRWKIENEGFNVQKNGGYALEHAYTSNYTAAKIFYFLLQFAHLVAQLLYQGGLLRTALRASLGSAKNLAFRLLEAWRNVRLDRAAIATLLSTRIQIRFYFDTS